MVDPAGVDSVVTARAFYPALLPVCFLAARRTFSPLQLPRCNRVAETLGEILAGLSLTPYALQGRAAPLALSVSPSQGSPIFPAPLLHIICTGRADFHPRPKPRDCGVYVRMRDHSACSRSRPAVEQDVASGTVVRLSSALLIAAQQALDYPARDTPVLTPRAVTQADDGPLRARQPERRPRSVRCCWHLWCFPGDLRGSEYLDTQPEP